MRKIIALFLVLIMLFSLCACGYAENKIIGTWQHGTFSDIYFNFYEGGVGEFGDSRFAWECDGNIITITFVKTGRLESLKYDSTKDNFIVISDNPDPAFCRVYERKSD